MDALLCLALQGLVRGFKVAQRRRLGTPVLPVLDICRSFASSLLDFSNSNVPKSIMTTSKLPELNNDILTTWLPLTTPDYLYQQLARRKFMLCLCIPPWRHLIHGTDKTSTRNCLV